MPLAFVLVAAFVALVYLPRLLAWSVSLLIGVVLIRQSRRMARKLVRLGTQDRDQLSFDSRPSRSERRLMRNHLRLAVQLTELTSLLPSVMARANALTDR